MECLGNVGRGDPSSFSFASLLLTLDGISKPREHGDDSGLTPFPTFWFDLPPNLALRPQRPTDREGWRAIICRVRPIFTLSLVSSQSQGENVSIYEPFANP